MATATRTAAAKKTTVGKRPAKKTAPAQPSAPSPELRLENVPHDLIDLNLDNVRHDVPVDDALVALGESIRAEGLNLPLLLHPHPDVTGRYVLIDGHRRHVSIGLQGNPPAMPSLIRAPYKTRAELIAAMLRTYLHKVDLSPVEEAEAYEAMALDGLDDDAIAAMTSGNPRRVRERRRLTGLRDEQKAKLHAGQLNLEQAAALIEFADDPRATLEIERAISSLEPHRYKQVVASAKSRREQEEAKAKLKAKLKRARIRIIESDEDVPGGRWNHPNPYKLGVPNDLPKTREEHDATSCTNLAAFIRWAPDNVDWYCQDPTAHGLPMPGQTDAVDQAADLEEQRRREAADAEYMRDVEAHDAARVARQDYLRSLVRGQTPLDAAMVDALLRYAVLASFEAYFETGMADVATWLGLDDDIIDELGMFDGRELDIFRTATAAIPGSRLLLALITTDGEQHENPRHWEPRVLYGSRRAWLDLVGGPLGYEWTPWEASRLAEADQIAAEAVRDDADDDS